MGNKGMTAVVDGKLLGKSSALIRGGVLWAKAILAMPSDGTLSFKQVVTGISVAILDMYEVKLSLTSALAWRDQSFVLFHHTSSKQWNLMKDNELWKTPGIKFPLDRTEDLLLADEHWDWFWQILDKLTDLLCSIQNTSFQSLGNLTTMNHFFRFST